MFRKLKMLGLVSVVGLISSLGFIHATQTKMDSIIGQCLSTNEACLNTGEKYFIGEFNETFNTIGCSERCEQDLECSVWTWWGEQKLCMLFSGCIGRFNGCIDCQTGNRSCGLSETLSTVVSGGLGLPAQPNQSEVTILGENMTINNLEMPRSRWGHVSAYLESMYYVCGGSTELDGNLAPNDTCDAYRIVDVENSVGRWESVSPMLEARHSAAAVEMFGRIFVLGGLGIDGEYLKSVEIYEPHSRMWVSGQSMTVGLVGHCAVAVHDGILVVGGLGDGGILRSYAAFYNVTSNLWTSLPSMRVKRAYHGCSVQLKSMPENKTDHVVVVTGGLGQPGSALQQKEESVAMDSTEIFSFGIKRWNDFTPLPAPRAFHSQSTNNHIRLFGGVVNENITDEILELRGEEWQVSHLRLRSATRSGSASIFPSD
ncbi:kelch domain-containing protein 8B isoform X2 [Eurytemora carolleeae]|uniref:kelch domain-containing protein 8B isoform X2 n=1 Tax=Eurytemora carolleeae TaxID=1294199 RepID=UPI000C77BE8A|nr:kelch domain-containing protein 8B isoform X2 [Eurytemora carolleeae]|eukprot:XP_023341031.1 kelch domain-containing protein 8B-like isoform X2 [Eurytemora affinis]